MFFDDLKKLRSACTEAGDLGSIWDTDRIVSSPVFVGEKLARFGSNNKLLRKMCMPSLRFIR
jgi:hypothetical protein